MSRMYYILFHKEADMPYKDKARRDEYLANNCRMVTLRIMRESDADIMEWLGGQDHPSKAIKEILRDHIRREKASGSGA